MGLDLVKSTDTLARQVKSLVRGRVDLITIMDVQQLIGAELSDILDDSDLVGVAKHGLVLKAISLLADTATSPAAKAAARCNAITEYQDEAG